MAGLAGLQQNFGNRAVQRMLAQEQRQAAPQMAASVQRQTDDEIIPSSIAMPPEEIPEEIHRNLSGPKWVNRYPASDKVVDLENSFSESVTNFINALELGGASVEILATTWPPERAYLMHWAWLIAREEVDPRAVPPIDEIEFEADVSPNLDIGWWHGTLEASQKAAEELRREFGIDELEAPPPLNSRHVSGEAIDMRISWSTNPLIVRDPVGEEVEITEAPFDETNPLLIAVGAAYGVIHYGDVDADAVHWSVDGN
jgi:hypothetical protein